VRSGTSLSETTLSGRRHLKLIRDLRSKGWEVELLYLALPTVELAKSRVAERVLHGGHDIPEIAIDRRFPRSLRNLFGEYGSAASRTRCFMNDEDRPKIVFEQIGEERRIFREEEYRTLEAIVSL
jgi:predicted ABC-type ATPase